jgi:mono/diheme cytochrome c family protein
MALPLLVMLCFVSILQVSYVSAQVAGPANKEAVEFFEIRIRPLLAKKCFACHTNLRMGGLQLDSREGLLKGGDSGPAIVLGDPDNSLLIQAVRRTHERIKMPPPGKLPDEEIADFATWVKRGAVWPEATGVVSPSNQKGEYVITAEQRAFWSFQPLRKPPLPSVKDHGWPKSPLDRFILSKLEQKGLRPVKPAGKRALIRRATFDLVGLPPTPEEVDAFVSDSSPDAFAKVIDRLLASPHYGERWGRYWLDYARYADEKLARGDAKYANAFRYRDWVIQAFNNDMPYDLFVKAQIAGDLIKPENHENLKAGLGFFGLTPQDQDDRVDITTRVFLGLTGGCARCHDHKYDPIPTKDYYSLLGIFRSTEYHETALAPEGVVNEYQQRKKKIEAQKEAIKEFVDKHTSELGEILARKTSRYMVAAWKVITGANPAVASAAEEDKLDLETLERWIKYLQKSGKEHPYLKAWEDLLARRGTLDEVKPVADAFQDLVLSLSAEKKAIDDRNYVALGGAKGIKETKSQQFTNIESLEVKKYYLWRDLFSEPYTREAFKAEGGVFYYGPKQIDRFLSGEWKDHLQSIRSELAVLEKALPPQYPFLHAIRDSEKVGNAKIEIRGDPETLGEEAPRRFLAVLCDGECPQFKRGSGRLELADAIASPKNPLTARVMINRIWQLHFGQGIVRTSSNFGLLGDRPSHPELLDYLSSCFVENNWSIKAMHREIMLSATYALSTEEATRNIAQDPENRLFWRANMRRMDAESLRDTLLTVSGNLDAGLGGPASPLTDDNKRRTVYGFISRNKLDRMLQLFDFPDPNTTSERRLATVGPLQQLYFMNSSFVALQAKALAKRLNSGTSDDKARITLAYRLLFGRLPTQSEVRLGLDFLAQSHQSWPQYAQALLHSSEFSSLN